jgi:hypothetical protein
MHLGPKTKPIAEIAVQKHLLGLLCKFHYSKRQLVELTGVRMTTICRWIETYHRGPNNLVYIAKWERSKTVGPYTAFFAFGYCLEDAPKPLPLTKKEKNLKARRPRRIERTEKGLIHVAC